MGYDQWINEQMTIPPSLMLVKLDEVIRESINGIILMADSSEVPNYFSSLHFNYSGGILILK